MTDSRDQRIAIASLCGAVAVVVLLGLGLRALPARGSEPEAAAAGRPGALRPIAGEVAPESVAVNASRAAPLVPAAPTRRPAEEHAPPRLDERPTWTGSAALDVAVRQGETGVACRVEFLCGPNRGTVLETGPDGTLSHDGLYPGYSLVRLSGPSTPACQRELLLRHRQRVRFDVELGRFGRVEGRVLDDEGRGISGASVSLAGRETASGPDGSFACDRWASGAVLLVVRSPGRASYCTRLPEAAPGVIPVDVELRPACRLELELVGGRGEVQVLLVPGRDQRLAGSPPRAAYPWQELLPLRAPSGATIVLDDLPSGSLTAHAFGGRWRAASEEIWPSPDAPQRVRLVLEELPLLQGRVLARGEAVPDARVELLAEDPMRATLSALGDDARIYTTLPVELLPAAIQKVHTDTDGAFILGWWPRAARLRHLVVTDPDGSRRRVLSLERPDELRVEL